jgi:hypothetical protein
MSKLYRRLKKYASSDTSPLNLQYGVYPNIQILFSTIISELEEGDNESVTPLSPDTNL